MPARSASDDSDEPRSFAGLFWAGVGLAPVAALLLLIAEGTATLRVTAVLALLAAVLIGLSSALRGRSSRTDVAHSLAGQREEIRGEVRAEVAAGVQATHRMVGATLQPLRDEVEALRGQLDAIWAGAVRVPDGGHGSARVSAAATADAFGYGGQEQPPVGLGVAAVPPPAAASARVSSGRAAVPPAGAVPRPHVPTGVVRHTETVKVTTRQTIVEPEGERPDTAYGSGYYRAAAGWAAPPQRPGSAESDRAARGHREDVGGESGRSDGDNPAAHPRGRARDRWATVREDDGGRELRMGQRRARVRSDETGTELRFEDRWAAVREPRDRDEAHRGEWRAAASWQDEHVSYVDHDADESADPQQSRWAGGDGTGDRWRDRGDGPAASGDRLAETDGWEWPDRGANPPAAGWIAGNRSDEGWTDQGWTDQGWSDGDPDWNDRDWSDTDESLDGPASLAPASGRSVPAALPAASTAGNSWGPTWSEPERQPVQRGHRYRDDDAYGFPPSDGVPRAGGRQVGYERSDNRWG